MNTSRAKCDYLKKIRGRLADSLGVNLHQTECTFQGECTGTCPKCRQEEKILNTALVKRGVLTAAIAASALTLTGCSPADLPIAGNTLSGDVSGESHTLKTQIGNIFHKISAMAGFEQDTGYDELTGIVAPDPDLGEDDPDEVIELTGEVPYEYGEDSSISPA